VEQASCRALRDISTNPETKNSRVALYIRLIIVPRVDSLGPAEVLASGWESALFRTANEEDK
jgi:hypothetical protein